MFNRFLAAHGEHDLIFTLFFQTLANQLPETYARGHNQNLNRHFTCENVPLELPRA